MIKIYHNPRCSKSREGVCYLENLDLPHEIIKYIDDPLTEVELKAIIKKLKLKPIDLVRTTEKIWIDEFKNKELTDEQLIAIMVHYPKLIQRPIVVNGNKAVIARPPEKITEVL